MGWFARLTKYLAERKSSGQVLLIYGVGAVAVIGFAGLAVDGGLIFTRRRLAQNAADAAALVGARDIVNSRFSSIDADVTTYTHGNASSAATASWSYVNNAGASVSQSNGTGVSVLVTHNFGTLFIRVLGMSTFTVTARGTALVQSLAGTADVPFIVCSDALRYTNANNPPVYAGGILDYTTSPPSVLEAAVGTDFLVHGSKVSGNGNHGDCGWTGGSATFKGNAETGGCTGTPCYYPWSNGNNSGQLDVRVAGMQGCTGGIDSYVDGCVALLPIVPEMGGTGDNCPRPIPSTNGGNNMCVATWAAFQLYRGDNAGPPGCNSTNCHHAVLLGNVLVTQGVGIDWTPGASGTLVVRLMA